MEFKVLFPGTSHFSTKALNNSSNGYGCLTM